ncbi:NAD(P)H-dependent oxidoreductase [Streptomyces sp. NPDC005811]|uniref:NAD(P)H-dependent oxidoreductase n=1 Tax=Streptomyces sp. NPDC005811 TaxID=3154565 RepID=UPI0033F57A09
MNRDGYRVSAAFSASRAVRREGRAERQTSAGAYLFAVPMYNYSMPSVFKAWLDHIMIPGKTFAMGDADPASGTPQHGKDFVVPALETVLGDALGLDVRTITPDPHHHHQAGWKAGRARSSS